MNAGVAAGTLALSIVTAIGLWLAQKNARRPEQLAIQADLYGPVLRLFHKFLDRSKPRPSVNLEPWKSFRNTNPHLVYLMRQSIRRQFQDLEAIQERLSKQSSVLASLFRTVALERVRCEAGFPQAETLYVGEHGSTYAGQFDPVDYLVTNMEMKSYLETGGSGRAGQSELTVAFANDSGKLGSFEGPEATDFVEACVTILQTQHLEKVERVLSACSEVRGAVSRLVDSMEKEIKRWA